jgi:hypothetical protein
VQVVPVLLHASQPMGTSSADVHIVVDPVDAEVAAEGGRQTASLVFIAAGFRRPQRLLGEPARPGPREGRDSR